MEATLEAKSRDSFGKNEARRTRRHGLVPGVLYGGDGDSLCFDVDARELRVALASSGAVLDLSVDGAKATPVVLKELSRHADRLSQREVMLCAQLLGELYF